MNTEEAKKKLDEAISKLESFNKNSDPAFSSLLQMIAGLVVLIISAFESLKTSFDSLQKNHSELSDSFRNLSKTNSEQTATINEQTKTIKELTKTIKKYERALAEKNFTNKSLGDKAYGSSRNERNTADKNRDEDRSEKEQAEKKEKAVKGRATNYTTRTEKVYIDIFGNEISEAAAEELKGKEVVGDDGKLYKYKGFQLSSQKDEIHLEKVTKQYLKPVLERVYESGNDTVNGVAGGEAEGETVPVPSSPNADFLAKTRMSIATMVYVVCEWLMMKNPLNRISMNLASYGLEYSRQQLYSYTRILTCILYPVMEYLEKDLRNAKTIGFDETYWSCREKGRLTGDKIIDVDEDVVDAPPDMDGKTKRKEQKSVSKTLRSYIFGIVTERVSVYLHSLVRNSELPVQLLIDNGVESLTFLMSDAFYKFFKKWTEETGIELSGGQSALFMHGLCWVHLKRYFVMVLNFATDKNGNVIKDYSKQGWDGDIVFVKDVINQISLCFRKFNDITARCENDSSLDIVELKKTELKPLVNKVFDAGETFRKEHYNEEKKSWSCSNRTKTAVTYLLNNRKGLEAFLDSPYGIMHNNRVEQSFREIDVLRNSMMANDTIHGAETLALFYSLYKTSQMNGLDFKYYLREVITTMMKHINQIDFEKNDKGTITGYKGHSISDDILDSIAPWNLAKKFDNKNE